MRLLRRHLVTVRKPHVCQDCNRPICPGESATKTEWADSTPGAKGETVWSEYTCCNLQPREVRHYTGHNVWRARSLRWDVA